VCNFGAQKLRVTSPASHIRIATHEQVVLRDGALELPALAGAVVE
jgi:hypothetical protein